MAEDSPMIEVSIPSLEREVDESGKLRKLFRVEILFNGRKHFVLRRHSEFQTLHRKLKKILHPPDFPSKRSTHLRTKPLEQRRQQLEDYIQDLIYQYEEVPQVLLDFLHVKHFHSGNKISSLESFDDSDPQGYGCQLQHQRVVGFCRDPYLLESPSDLPDIVMDGVLQGLYPRDIRVSFTACTKPSLPERPSLAPGPARTFKAPAIPSI
ncbi:sorting nexin-22 isoform 2-T2 [Salvelinus alpinus]|uniref:sorting nexin-22 isoform X2 n=1 Tax=Salvelinus sp. IW2-2015 TaxID=2691554 RepID=UPI000CDFBB2F|nr:sorting nexin-24 isoform X2 [Salvelinus alpinus]